LVEYTALLLGGLGLMFFLFETGFRLSTPGFIENEIMDLMDFIKIGFFFAAFAVGFLVVGLMNIIVGENGGSLALSNFVGLFIWVWGLFFLLTVAGFGIYFIWWIPKKVKEKMKKKQEQEEA
jgi:hypothetical protein